MRRKGIFFLISLIVILLPLISNATTYSFAPPDADLKDLDHSWADLWGIEFDLKANEKVVSATLFFDNIRNWRIEPNDLYVSLLEDAQLGYSRELDTNLFPNHWEYHDHFLLELEHYVDLSNIAQDLIYNFSNDELAQLNLAIGDGFFGLGFDADCHFYNDGIYLTIETVETEMPEPGSIILFFLGIIGLSQINRKRRE